MIPPCSRCGSEQIQLFTGFACKKECDLKPKLELTERLSHLQWITEEVCVMIVPGPPPEGWTRVRWWNHTAPPETAWQMSTAGIMTRGGGWCGRSSLVVAQKPWNGSCIGWSGAEMLVNGNFPIDTSQERPTYFVPKK